MASLKLVDWLLVSPRIRVRRFEEVDVAADREIDDDVLACLADVIVRTLADPAVLSRLAGVIGSEAALARLRAGRKAVVRGDFGEVLAGACLEDLEGLGVPVKKLRYKLDPEQTLPGTDILAIERRDARISAVHYLESKLRTGAALDAAVEAHKQLADDRDAKFAATLEFVLERLASEHRELYEELMAFLEAHEPPATEPRSKFGVFLTWDDRTWNEEVLDRLNREAILLEPLHVRIAQLPELAALVVAAYDRIGIEVVDDGS